MIHPIENDPQYMRELVDVIDELKLIEHKKDILDCLHQAWKKGPCTKPFNREFRWHDIEVLTDTVCGSIGVLYQSEEFEREAEQAAKALARAGWFFEKTARRRMELYTKMGHSPNDTAGWQEHIDDLAAAQDALKRSLGPKRGRGGQANTGQLPPWFISLVALVFYPATGVRMTSSHDGPFVEFLVTYGNALGLADLIRRGTKPKEDLSRDTVVRAVKHWLKLVRPLDAGLLS